uniref:YeaC family protein n=1 Tax=Marinobacterium profundum TaxID=1714300 RepID=UPI00082D8B03|nr:DUF1315 family protein [Marinobacterium profundum]
MNYEQLIETMTPEIHRSLKLAVEIGKWPNGERLSAEQRTLCLRAVIAYDQNRLPESERTGFIDRTRPDGAQHGSDPLQPQTIKIIN